MNSPLQGGAVKRRRGNRRLLTLLAVLIAIGAVSATVVLGGEHHRSSGSGSKTHGDRLPADAASIAMPAGPPGISFGGSTQTHLHFKRPPRAGLLLDVDSGEVLWSRNPLKRLPIASLTKVMTALIVVKRIPAGAETRISKNATKFRGSEVGVLPRGKKVPIEALLAGMLLPSGNDAAVALAEAAAGSDRRFAKESSRHAQELGLGCTHFVDSYGLHRGNVSCAADLGAMTRLAMREPRITRIVRHPHLIVPFPISGHRLDVYATNPLLRTHYPGTIGLKTGTTDPAGHCLIAVVRHGKRTLAAIVLNSPDTRTQAERMLEAGFRALRR
ncbi:MAG: hypothetical protein QOE06_2910 [Thermoleophilaceae bacterium]|nr:hypothetical protein [Thermoleophilaceae bacterium]